MLTAVRWERCRLRCEANVGGGIMSAVGSFFFFIFHPFHVFGAARGWGFGTACPFVTGYRVK